MPPYPIRRNAASCLATARFAFADGQQPRVGAISCASEGTGLTAGRNSSRASGSRAGERGGAFPSQRRVYRNAAFEDDCKAAAPESLIEQRLFLIRMSANVIQTGSMLRYTNPLIESQRLMYSSRSLRTWSAVYGPSLELNDCQPVCR